MNAAQKDYWHHRATVAFDGRPDWEPVLFRWHWPRGVLDKRMSALEIAAFLMPHLPSVVPLMADHPQAQAELQAILIRFVTWPQSVLDEVHGWIRNVIHGEEDDIVELSIGGKLLTPAGPRYFV